MISLKYFKNSHKDIRTYLFKVVKGLVTCVVSSTPPLYSTPRVSGGNTSAITGNSPLSLPPTMRKLKMPSGDVTTVISLTSLDQWWLVALGPMGLRLSEVADDRGDLRSPGDRLADVGGAADDAVGAGDGAMLLLSLYLLGVVGLLRCFNIVAIGIVFFTYQDVM